MRSVEIKTYNLDMAAEFGPVGYGAESKTRISELVSSLGSGSLLLANFTNVEDITAGFLEAIHRGSFDAHHNDQWPMLALTNINDDVEGALRSHARTFVVAVNEEAQLFNFDSYEQRDFKAAKKLSTQEGAFTLDDLAKELGLSMGTTNERLRKLAYRGAITRKQDGPSPKNFLYRSVIDSDLITLG